MESMEERKESNLSFLEILAKVFSHLNGYDWINGLSLKQYCEKTEWLLWANEDNPMKFLS